MPAKRTLAWVVAVLLVPLSAQAVATEASAAGTAHVSIGASAATAPVGARLTVSGAVTPPVAGGIVTIEQRNAGTSSWRTVATAMTGADGGYRATLTMKSGADRYYRARVAARPGYRKAVSATSRKVVVTQPKVSITANAGRSTTTVLAGTTIWGTVTPYVVAAPRVTVQRRAVGTSRWTTIATVALRSDGSYVVAWTPTTDADQQFRVTKAAGGGYAAASSPIVKVVVTATSSAARVLPASEHSVSLGIEDVVTDDGETRDWAAMRSRLDDAHVNMVHLAAGRVEWTAFDWAAHPEVAANAGTDHLAVAMAELGPMSGGGTRSFDLLIDALVPSWIKADPSIAGVDASGHRATYTPSASAIHDGAVGDRYVQLARDLALRYRPAQITFTELMFDDETFGADDLALYRRMTGASDWPRTRGGGIDESSPKIAAWRAQVLDDLLARVRRALDQVQPTVGHRVQLAMDVRVNWNQPSAGRPECGDDYVTLLQAADRLVLWAYFGTAHEQPSDVARLTAALRAAKVPASRYAVSIGLWSGADESSVLSASQLAAGVTAAASNGSANVNVTPFTLMTDAAWSALDRVWTSWTH